jgi:hypothetical protein
VPRYFPLKSGEFIQGLLATIAHHWRVYVVTVPLPAEHEGEAWQWPRLIGTPQSGLRSGLRACG